MRRGFRNSGAAALLSRWRVRQGWGDRMKWPWQPQGRACARRPAAIPRSSARLDRGAGGRDSTQQASATAALEASSGLLSRAFASATVDAPDDVAEALSPRTLAQIGRDLVRVGESASRPALHGRAHGSG